MIRSWLDTILAGLLLASMPFAILLMAPFAFLFLLFHAIFIPLSANEKAEIAEAAREYVNDGQCTVQDANAFLAKLDIQPIGQGETK